MIGPIMGGQMTTQTIGLMGGRHLRTVVIPNLLLLKFTTFQLHCRMIISIVE